MSTRPFCAAMLFLMSSLGAHAQSVDVSILIDDRDGIGCPVTPPGLPAFTGIDARLTASVDRLAAQVTTVELELCTGAAFGPPSTVGGGHPVGNDNGVGGADVVEMSVLRALATGSSGGLNVAAVADNGLGADATGLGLFGAPPTAVPGLGPLGLLVLALAVLALAGVALKRRRALLSVLLVGLSFAVLALNFMVDGQIPDWAGVPQLASDPLGDGTNGETAVDIVAVFAGQEDQGSGPELFFRVDMADLIINNLPPVAVDDAVTSDEDNPVAGDLFADNGGGADSDPDLDPFSVTMVAGTGTVGAPVNLPSGAQVTVNADGTFGYDPLAAFNSLSQGGSAVDTFTYTIDDMIAGSDQATVTVTVTGINDVGTAADDTFGTPEDTPLAVGAPGVLINDSDPDAADTPTAVLDTGPGNALSFTLNPDGSFSYTPALNFNGADAFTYHANDGIADTNVATVTINVGAINDPPVAVDDSGDATDEDTPITTQDVLVNDSDPEMDPLSVASVDLASALGATITNNGDGTFNYDPTSSATLNALSVGQMTIDTFSYTVTDGFLNDTATVSVTVIGVNDPMTAVDDAGLGFATDEDTPFTTGNVLSNDTDPDAADTLSVMSADAASVQGATITDNGDGTFGYDPTGAPALQALAAGAMLTDTFGYTGTDSNGSTDTATVSIEVAGINDAPVLAFPSGGATFNNLGPVNIDPLATVTDVDSPDFDSGDLTASLSLSADTSMCDVDDILTVEDQGMGAGQIGFDGVNVGFEGTQFGTVTTAYLCTDLGGGLFDIQPLLIAFDPDASLAAVTALLRALQYNTTSADDQDREASAMVTDGDGGTSNAALATITVNLNVAPTITSDGGGAMAAVNAPENQTGVTTVTATDPNAGQMLTFSISGGADGALFSIGAMSGVLTFSAPPDFESPGDAGADNVYDVQVTVTDDGTPILSDSQDIAVTVTDVNEAPMITSDGGGATAMVNAAENQTAVTDVMSTDPEGDTEGSGLSYSLTGGADMGLFSIVAGTGVLTFNVAPDFETPGDANTDNDYEVQVTVTDSGALTDVQDITVTVTDVNEAPTITSDGGGATATVNAAENQTAVTDVMSTDPEGDTEGSGLTYSLTGGADQASFSIVAGTGVLTFNAAPDFESPGDANTDNDYEVQVTVTDSGTLTDVQDITVTVTNANDPPVITSDGGGATAMVSVNENTTAVTDVQSIDQDGDTEGAGLSYTITGGADMGLFSIVAGTGVLTFMSAPDFENPGDANMDNDYLVQVTVTDSGALTDVQDITVSVQDVNEAPTAMDESFDAQSNVGIAPNAMNGLLSNDTDPDASDTVSLTAGSVGTFATTAGGSITTAADGSFTYTPQAGDAGVMDTFAYTVQDSGGLTDNATATFNVDSNTIWFVDLDAGTTGDGTLGNPFDSLADLDNGGPDANGSTIFHYTSTMGAQTDALSDDFDLQANQFLIGEGATGMGTINALRGFTTHPFSPTLPSIGAAANHTITSSANGGITLATGNTIRGLTIGNTGTGTGIAGANFGTLTIDDVTINGTGGILNLDTGTVSDPTASDFTFGGLASTSNPGIGIDLNAVGGSFTVDTTTSITGGTLGIDIDNTPAATSFDFGSTTIGGGTDAGIDIATSGSGTFTFDSLSITNDSGTGLRANTGGTVNVGGTMNAVSSTGGPGIDITSTSLGGGATFASVSSSTSAGDGINLDSVTGSLTINGGSITGSTGIAFDLNAGSSNVTYAGSITNTSGLSVDVTSRTGGTALFSGAVSGTGNGTGINLSGNMGATMTFSGTLTLNTGNSAALNATGGGIVNVTGAANTIGATTPLSGTAVNIVGTTIGPSHVTFRSIAVNGAGVSAVPGIILTNTGAGQFHVTGTGAAGSGGTIENILFDAVRFSNTDGRVTFEDMIIEDIGLMTGALNTLSGHDAIHGENVDGGLTLDNVTIRRISDDAVHGETFGAMGPALFTNFAGLEILNSLIEDTNRYHDPGACSPCGDDNNEGMVRIRGINGTVNVTNSTLRRGAELLDLSSSSAMGDVLTMTVQNSNFNDSFKGISMALGAKGLACINVKMRGPTDANIHIGDPLEAMVGLGNTFTGCATVGVAIKHDDETATGDIDVIISRNDLDNSAVEMPPICCGTFGGPFGLGNWPQNSILLRPRGTTAATMDAIVSQNLMTVPGLAEGNEGSITVFHDGVSGGMPATAGTLQARVSENTATRPFVAGKFVVAEQNTAARVLAEDNQITGGSAMHPDFGATPVPGNSSKARTLDNASLDATVEIHGHGTSVVSSSPGFPGQDVTFTEPQSASYKVQGLGNPSTLCASFSNNTSDRGYELREDTGSAVSVFRGASGLTSCTIAAPVNCETVLDGLGNTGGPTGGGQGVGNPAMSPPDVDVSGTSGTIDLTATACGLPSGPITGGSF